MEKDNIDNYNKHHRTLPNEDLVRIAYFEIRKIKKEARKSAKQILKERKIKDLQLEEYKIEIRKIKREERREKLYAENNGYNLGNFIIEFFSDVIIGSLARIISL